MDVASTPVSRMDRSGCAHRSTSAFDVNPFPDKDRESKTWLSESSGPITSLEQLLSEAPYFGLTRIEAETAAGRIAIKLADWRKLGRSAGIGLSDEDLNQLTPAFEHNDAQAARKLAR